jgi:hypothetical protein
VLIDAPDMRLVARRLLPSVSIVRICARRSMLSRFILNIMRERSDRSLTAWRTTSAYARTDASRGCSLPYQLLPLAWRAPLRETG